MLIHLAAFFLTALVCHQALVARRPQRGHLTDFYICMSLGGVLGGSFNAFAAPLIFSTVLEYPLFLVLSAVARPWNLNAPVRPWVWIASAVALLAAVAATFVVHPPPEMADWVYARLGRRPNPGDGRPSRC